MAQARYLIFSVATVAVREPGPERWGPSWGCSAVVSRPGVHSLVVRSVDLEVLWPLQRTPLG